MKITILGREVELKATFRAYIIFENITGKSFRNLDSLVDVLTFMYATVLGSAKVTDISFDEFLDYIDEHPDVVHKFSEWMTKSNEVVNEASNKLDEDTDTKKNKRRKKQS